MKETAPNKGFIKFRELVYKVVCTGDNGFHGYLVNKDESEQVKKRSHGWSSWDDVWVEVKKPSDVQFHSPNYAELYLEVDLLYGALCELNLLKPEHGGAEEK